MNYLDSWRNLASVPEFLPEFGKLTNARQVDDRALRIRLE